MGFSDHQLEELRARADLVAMVGRRVTLRRSGKDFVGLCPFHGEKSPSFYVVPPKQLWHCFGCGATGDVFGFYMKLDGLSFVETVQLVAKETGVILVDEKLDPEEARRRARLDALSELLDRTIKFYEQKLWRPGGQPALDHLFARGVSEEMLRRFRIGFGGRASEELARALEKAGADTSLAAEAGLLINGRSGRWFDRFQGRLIIPIRIPRPPHGRPVALGGRYLEGITPAPAGRKPAKYVNSPETPLYSKGSVLFGLAEARDTIRRVEKALVVEGYFDVIGVHQAGLPLAVATCGTALTPSHVDLLTRSGARELVFLFDGDAAGVRAAARAAELCARAQVPSRVASLPEGLDPDEFARQRGVEGLEALMERAKPAVEYLIDKALDGIGPRATVEDRVRVVHEVKPLVLSAPDGLSRELYIAEVAERLGVSVGVVQETLFTAVDTPEEGGRPGRRSEGGAGGRPMRTGAPTAAPGSAAELAADLVRPGVDLPPEMAPAGPSTEPRSSRRPAVAPALSQAELGVVVALARFPAALAALVASSGVAPGFQHPELRRLAELLVAQQAAGASVAPEALWSTVADPRLRDMLTRRASEDDSSLDQTASHLQMLLDKCRVEARQRRAREALRQARDLSDDASRRAFEEQQQQQLQEAQEVHRRMRERQRGG